ncbi:MAG: acyl-CoA thioesterase [Solirubrobacteraceae bacterium]|nr:acyl-CoA thioesterase [Solirubrobacteraceae bacterium]
MSPGPDRPHVDMPLRVRWHECDPQGVVFNANYLTYFDMAIGELWRDLYGSYAALQAEGVDTMVAETTLRYRAAARFDDELVVRAAVERLGTTSFVIAFRVTRGDDLIAEGESRYVFVDVTTLTKAEPPAEVRRRLGG